MIHSQKLQENGEAVMLSVTVSKDSEEKLQTKKDAETKKKKAEEKPKVNFAELERDFCELLNGEKPVALNDLGNFPFHFEVVRSRAIDEPIVLKIENHTAEIVSIKYIAGKLRHYVQNLCGKHKKYNVALRHCSEFANAWAVMYTHRKDLPRAVGFFNDLDLCLNRLSYDPISIDLELLKIKAPIFFDYLDRMTNSDAFCARLGSLFDFRAHRKQAIWMQGPRDAGKSQLIEIIRKLVGASNVVMSGDALDEKYWKDSVVGKRAMILSETKPHFLRTEGFKSLTGDRVHMIRPFHGKPYQAILEPIVFFFSNHAPEVPNDDPLTSRIIACQIKAIPEDKKVSEFDLLERVDAELPFIAGYCLDKWKAVPSGRAIPNDDSVLKAAAEDYEAPFLDFIANYLEIGKGFYAECNLVSFLMEHAGLRSNAEKSICKRVILSRGDILQKRTVIPEGNLERRVNCYSGLRIKPEKRKYLPI